MNTSSDIHTCATFFNAELPECMHPILLAMCFIIRLQGREAYYDGENVLFQNHAAPERLEMWKEAAGRKADELMKNGVTLNLEPECSPLTFIQASSLFKFLLRTRKVPDEDQPVIWFLDMLLTYRWEQVVECYREMQYSPEPPRVQNRAFESAATL